ncbi:hypothetical protein TNCV_1843561 [Trichonephila clavipes]|nr:hypothetical protein TNCV_1843561 [Trichonephila clavipes]
MTLWAIPSSSDTFSWVSLHSSRPIILPAFFRRRDGWPKEDVILGSENDEIRRRVCSSFRVRMSPSRFLVQASSKVNWTDIQNYVEFLSKEMPDIKIDVNCLFEVERRLNVQLNSYKLEQLENQHAEKLEHHLMECPEGTLRESRFSALVPRICRLTVCYKRPIRTHRREFAIPRKTNRSAQDFFLKRSFKIPIKRSQKPPHHGEEGGLNFQRIS